MPSRRDRRTPRPDFAVAVSLPGQLRPGDGSIDDDALITARSFVDADLGGTTAHLVDLEECRWQRSSLADASLTKLTASDQDLDNCDLALLKAPEASLSRVIVRNCRMSGMSLTGATAQQVEFTDGIAEFSGWRFTRLRQVRFERCRLAHADFTGARFDQVVFRDCDLTEAEFHQADVSSAWFIDCTWERTAGIASLRGATLAHTHATDVLALVPQLADALGLRLADPADLAGN